MNLRVGTFSLIFSLVVAFAGAQTAPPPAAAVPPSAMLQQSLAEIQGSTSALNIGKWKAPGSVRQAAQEDIDSIQRDLGTTLPGLLAQADAAPASLPPTFAVYRNIDALYDVLLRVSETADLAAPSNEAASVATCLQKLETARSQLGDSIVRISQRNEAQMMALAAAVRAEKSDSAAHRRETVVDDGPAKSAERKTRRKPSTKKPAAKPAPGATPSGAPQ